MAGSRQSKRIKAQGDIKRRKTMVDLKEIDFYEKNFVKNATQGTIEECRDFMAAQQEFIRSLVKENEKLRERILDDFINK